MTAAASQQALAHVYAADQGLNLVNETVDLLAYDDATLTAMVIKGQVVFAFDLSGESLPGSQEQLKWTYPLQEGPAVASMRCSLDGEVLGLVRGRQLLELAELATGNTAVHTGDKGRSDLLGFFFTENPDAEVVLVTKGGLEMCQFVSRRQGLRRADRVKLSVNYHVYTHETRMVMLNVGPPGAQYFQAYQFITNGMVTLPIFNIMASVPPVLPVSNGSSSLLSAGGLAVASSTPISLPMPSSLPSAPVPVDCIRLLKMYGRVYCAHINRASKKLELYRFYTDTVLLQHTYELYSDAVDLSVIDNILVITHMDSAVSVLVDVGSSITQPITNPLPLAILPAPVIPRTSSGNLSAMAPLNIPAPMFKSSSSLSMHQWEFRAPSIVLDKQNQALYRLFVDIKAIGDSCSDPTSLTSFLLRRRALPVPPALACMYSGSSGSSSGNSLAVGNGTSSSSTTTAAAGSSSDASPAATAVAAVAAASSAAASMTAESAANQVAVQPRQLLLQLITTSLLERLPLSSLRRMFDDVNKAYMDYAVQHGSFPPPPSTASTGSIPLSPSVPSVPAINPSSVQPAAGPQVLTPEELAHSVFEPLHVDSTVDKLYLQAALTEYQASAAAIGLPMSPDIYSLSVHWSAQQGQVHSVVQLVRGCTNPLPADVADEIASILPAMNAAVEVGVSAQPANAGLPGNTSSAAGSPIQSASVVSASAAGIAATHSMPEEAEEAGPSQPGAHQTANSATNTAAASGIVPDIAAASAVDTSRDAAKQVPTSIGEALSLICHAKLAFSSVPAVAHDDGRVATAVSSSAVQDATSASQPVLQKATAEMITYVQKLVEAGQVLRAVRLARQYNVNSISARQFLEAAAERRQVHAMVAVYREFRDELLPSFPKFAKAAELLLPVE